MPETPFAEILDLPSVAAEIRDAVDAHWQPAPFAGRRPVPTLADAYRLTPMPGRNWSTQIAGVAITFRRAVLVLQAMENYRDA